MPQESNAPVNTNPEINLEDRDEVDSFIESEDLAEDGGSTNYQAYEPPPGYVLVEKGLYQQMLKAFARAMDPAPVQAAPATPIMRDEYGVPIPVEEYRGVFHLRMLRQYWFGDINTNLQPGDEIEFCPGQYVKISGEKHKKLKAFLTVFRSQFGPDGPAPDVVKQPIFEILNPDECPDPFLVFGRSTGPQKRRFASEEERVRFEEGKGDAAQRRVNVPGDVHDQLQLRTGPQPRTAQREVPPGKPAGMTDRAWIIANMQADQIERPQGSNVGSGQNDQQAEPQSVSDFNVTSRMAGGGVAVAQIPGGPADEARAAAIRNPRRR